MSEWQHYSVVNLVGIPYECQRGIQDELVMTLDTPKLNTTEQETLFYPVLLPR